jgi:iron complex transport system substrate-binding protein
MTTLSRRSALLGLLASTALTRTGWAQPRKLTDSVGRSVEAPARATRVMAAGPPASILLYVLAPEAMVGWVPPPLANAKPFLLPGVRDLPSSGRLTGRGSDIPEVESIARQKPDLIVDFGSIAANYVTLADKVQDAAHVPYALIDGALEKTAAALRLAGDLLGRRERAERLALYAEQTLAKVEAVLKEIPAGKRLKVYVARGPDATLTAVAGSGLTEVVEKAGGINVAQGKSERGGALTVTIEQVAAWNPDFVIAFDRAAWQALTKPDWRDVPAVNAKRVFAAPMLPWNWLGEPPAVNRLLGLRWMLAILYTDVAKLDMKAEARAFHSLFYGVTPSDGDLEKLLQDA